MKKTLLLVLAAQVFLFSGIVFASDLEVVEQDKQAPVQQTAIVQQASSDAVIPATAPQEVPVPSVSEPKMVKASDDTTPANKKKVMPMPPAVSKAIINEPTLYTLGPDDIIEVVVRRHPEFSDKYIINAEGKIQYKFVGDIEIKGLTKTEVKDKIANILGKFIISPDLDVSILEYKSKVIYVIGEVGSPGKYYMKADKISLREAVVQAGLPTLSAAMRRTTLVRPDKSGKPKEKIVDLYALLYEGKLNLDQVMLPGDVLVVPATLFAKIFRIISPVTSTVSSAKSVATPY